MQAELKGKVGDQFVSQGGVSFREPGVVRFHIAVKLTHDPVVLVEEVAVVDHGVHAGTIHIT